MNLASLSVRLKGEGFKKQTSTIILPPLLKLQQNCSLLTTDIQDFKSVRIQHGVDRLMLCSAFQKAEGQSFNSRKDSEYLQQIGSQMEYSQEFQPSSCSQFSEEHYGRPKKQQKYVSGQNNGKWSEIQNTKYIVYIEFHKEKMRSKEKRRVSKFYKEMSKWIGTRNALQCRSHHQKLEDRYLYPNKIIANYKQHNEMTLYAQLRLELQQFEQKSTITTTPSLKLPDEKQEYATQAEIPTATAGCLQARPDVVPAGLQTGNSTEVWLVDPMTYLPGSFGQGIFNMSNFIYCPYYGVY